LASRRRLAAEPDPLQRRLRQGLSAPRTPAPSARRHRLDDLTAAPPVGNPWSSMPIPRTRIEMFLALPI